MKDIYQILFYEGDTHGVKEVDTTLLIVMDSKLFTKINISSIKYIYMCVYIQIILEVHIYVYIYFFN